MQLQLGVAVRVLKVDEASHAAVVHAFNGNTYPGTVAAGSTTNLSVALPVPASASAQAYPVTGLPLGAPAMP